MEMQLLIIRSFSSLQISQECLGAWLEKRKKHLEENLGKNLVEPTVPSRNHYFFAADGYK